MAKPKLKLFFILSLFITVPLFSIPASSMSKQDIYEFAQQSILFYRRCDSESDCEPEEETLEIPEVIEDEEDEEDEENQDDQGNLSPESEKPSFLSNIVLAAQKFTPTQAFRSLAFFLIPATSRVVAFIVMLLG